MSTDPNLNETGRINLGDVDQLQQNTNKIYDPTGKVASSATQEEAERMAAKIFKSNGVTWHLDEEETEKQGKDMFFPQLRINGLSEKFGQSRSHQKFYKGERNMFVQAFMNDCGSYLFGIDPFNEVNTSDGVAFRPNPEWERLPVA